jgi:hypothetical protein
MTTTEIVLLGGAFGFLAVALYKGSQTTLAEQSATNYAADATPGAPLPEGVYGPAVPAEPPTIVEGLQ